MKKIEDRTRSFVASRPSQPILESGRKEIEGHGCSDHGSILSKTRSSLKISQRLVFGVMLAAVLSCTPNQRIVESVPTPAPPAVAVSPKVNTFENDLQSMRNADFRFILVFRRKDDEPMNGEDKTFVNENTPFDTNRRKLSDDGKAIIVGSNFPFIPGTIGKLTDRFVMEDHSRSDAGPLEVDRTIKKTNANKR